VLWTAASHSGDPVLKPPLRARLPLFRCVVVIPTLVQEDASVFSLAMTHSWLPSTSFPIHYSLIIYQRNLSKRNGRYVKTKSAITSEPEGQGHWAMCVLIDSPITTLETSEPWLLVTTPRVVSKKNIQACNSHTQRDCRLHTNSLQQHCSGCRQTREAGNDQQYARVTRKDRAEKGKKENRRKAGLRFTLGDSLIRIMPTTGYQAGYKLH
jgi:hypothetical protein